jgi:hypothetical protein
MRIGMGGADPWRKKLRENRQTMRADTKTAAFAFAEDFKRRPMPSLTAKDAGRLRARSPSYMRRCRKALNIPARFV